MSTKTAFFGPFEVDLISGIVVEVDAVAAHHYFFPVMKLHNNTEHAADKSFLHNGSRKTVGTLRLFPDADLLAADSQRLGGTFGDRKMLFVADHRTGTVPKHYGIAGDFLHGSFQDVGGTYKGSHIAGLG